MSTDKPNPDGKAPILPALPAGVVAARYGKDGKVRYILDPASVNLRWEGVTIDSDAFMALSMPERLYRQSSAYLQAATLLCEKAGEVGDELEWPQASVCYYCLHLATELFLKACINRVEGQPKKLTHEIADLLRHYRELLPGKEFDFRTFWRLSASDINSFVGQEVMQGVERTPDQLYRYGTDKSGAPSSGVHFFNPGYLFNYMTEIERRWSAIWNHIDSVSGAK